MKLHITTDNHGVTMATNLYVEPKNGEAFDRVFKRFTRKTTKFGFLDEYKEKLTYTKPSAVRREQRKNARHKTR